MWPATWTSGSHIICSLIYFQLPPTPFYPNSLFLFSLPLHQIHTSLHQAYNNLSAFLSAIQFPPTPENSVSSTNGAKTIQLVDDGEEETSKCTIDRVEQKLRDCFIKNKRPKRPLSPSVAELEEEKRFSGDGFVEDYDPHALKLKALDFVCQFHG